MNLFSIILIFLLLLVNYYLYKKKYINNNLFIISSIFILIYSVLSILIYFNNINQGFELGILFGDVQNNHFCDEYRYWMDSEILLNHFKNGEFIKWFNKELPYYEYMDPHGHPGFGNYNIFVVLVTLFKVIGFKSVLNLILLKIIIYIPTYIYLYKLAKIYLSEKYALISVCIFSALPGYILTSSLLMRDNIILLLIIALLYYILARKFNYLVLIPLILLLFKFRSYMILIFIATIIFCYKNSKKVISKIDIFYVLIIVATILFFINFTFTGGQLNFLGFSDEQMRILQENFIFTYGNNLPMILNLFTKTLLEVVVDPIFTNFLTSGNIYLILLSIGNILATILSIIFGIKFLFLLFNKSTKNNFKLINLLKFTFYFTLLSSLLVMSKDGYIINRIALMWLPLFVIIVLIPLNKKHNKI